MSAAGDRDWPTAVQFDRIRAPPLIAYIDANAANDAELVVAARGVVNRYVALVERAHYEFRPALASDARHAGASAPPSSGTARLLLWFRRPRRLRTDARFDNAVEVDDNAEGLDNEEVELDVDTDEFADDAGVDRVPWRAGDALRLFERDSRDLVAHARVVGDPEQGEATGRVYVDIERWASPRRRAMLARFVVE